MFGIARLFSVIATFLLSLRAEGVATPGKKIAELGLLRLRLATASAPRNDKGFRNVVRGFSRVLHDPEGSHYKSGLCLVMTKAGEVIK